MKVLGTIIFFACALLTQVAAAANGPVTTRVEQQGAEQGRGIVQLTIRNEGDVAVYIFEQLSPTSAPENELPFDLLDVTLADGRAAKYTGVFANMGTPGPSNFVEIPPGSTLVHKVDLRKMYKSATGPVTVSMKPIHYWLQRFDPSVLPAPAEAGVSSGNTLQMWVNAALTSSARDMIKVTPMGTTQCSATSKTATDAAFQAARALSTGARNSINTGWTIVQTSPEIVTQYNPSPRFKEWFGNASQPRRSDDPYVDVGTPKALAMIVMIENSFNHPQPSLICDPCAGFGANTAAHVMSDDGMPHVDGDLSTASIAICPFFFTLTQSDQAATIIHELTHFTFSGTVNGQSNVVAGTADLVMSNGLPVYGYSVSKQFAQIDPNRATQNADNYAYFYLNPDHL